MDMNNPTNSVMQQKSDLRKTMLAERAALTPEVKQLHSQAICDKLWQWAEQAHSQVVHTYLPMGHEVNIFPFIERALEAGLTVVAPKSLRKRRMENLLLHSLSELEAGIFGTSHPASGQAYLGTYDLFVVPGLAFDLRGNRLGYGAGYYDLFLAGQATGHKLGVCFPFQVLDELPSEAHDVRMDGVVSGGKGFTISES